MSELDIPLCMRWTVDTRNKPDYAHPKRSSALRCRGGEWSLYYRYCYIWGHHVLGLQKMTDVSPDPFDVSVLVEGGGTGRIATDLSQKTRCTDGYSGTSDEGKIYQWDIWVRSNSYVERTDPELNRIGHLRFLVVIQDKDAPTEPSPVLSSSAVSSPNLNYRSPVLSSPAVSSPDLNSASPVLSSPSVSSPDLSSASSVLSSPAVSTPDLFCVSPLRFPPAFSYPRIQPHSMTFVDVSVQTNLTANSISSLDSLSEDIAKMLDMDSNPDVELHCDGNTTKAHRALLSMRSPVLAKMFQTEMVERNTGVVNIQNMSAETFQFFLKYLHSGKLEQEALTFDLALDLYEAGDMYEVKSLSRLCAQFLVQNLTVDNARDALAVADAHSDSDLEEKVTTYIAENEIPLSDDLWSEFWEEHPKLANKVYKKMISKLSQHRQGF